VKLVIYEPGILHPQLIDELKSITRVVSLEATEQTIKNSEETNTNLAVTVSPGNLAYVIYTSGSTGKPKGVMVEQPGMMNHLFAKLADIEITSASVIAQNASQCFDISVWQFFAALLKGGQTVVYTNQWVLNPGELIKQIGSHSVTILEVVPSYLTMILDIIEEQKPDHLFPRLKYLLVTGETVRPTLVKRWFERFPNIKMVNAYGPTEASDDITHYKMEQPPHPGSESIPIGRTVRNFRIYIVDNQMNLCPIGVKGEICVSGIGIGRGYLNRPELTVEKFDHDLWDYQDYQDGYHRSYKSYPSYITYKTGDLGRWLQDGNIEFFGRKDYQVKIRGYRIELEEIENKLAALPGIRDTVVIDKEDKEHKKHLYAYVTLQEGEEKKVEEIKRQLRTLLPEYMIPANIVILEALPLTPNGKVDRKALPEPGAADISSLEYVPPGNDTEKKLVEIFQEILGIKKIGIHDSFFNLGGDSFKGIRIVNKIQEWLQEVVHVTILFLAPTIAELAVKLESYKLVKHTRVDTAKIEKMRRIIPPLPPLPDHRKSALKNPPAIFILCPPRSGSTLLRVILTGHPQLFAPQEFELMTFNTLQERKQGLSGKFSFYLEGVIRAIMEIKGIDAHQAKNIMEEFETRDLTCREFYRVLQQWLGERMLIEKTPAYTLDPEILKRIEEYFDSPLYLHLVRNPYAVIHSFENAKLDQIFKYEHDFPPRELAELVWLISNQNIREFLKSIPANRQRQIHYEEMVNEPEQVVSGICQFLGVEYYPGLIQVYKNPEKRMTDGIYAESKMLGDVRFFSHTSINTGSVEKWKEKYKTQFLGDEALQMARSLGYLWESSSMDYSGLEPAPDTEHYALSPAQKRLWTLSQFEDNQLAYNMPRSYLLQGNLNRKALENAFETVIRRHESLRTTFITVNGEPRQKIHQPRESGFKLEYIDLKNQENREEKAKAIELEESITPFDLEKGPLLRTRLIHLEENKYVFLLTTHHIISDGWSMRLLTNEILTLYEVHKNNKKDPLLPLHIQYKDYAAWQNRETNRQILEQQEEYWLKEFAGNFQLLNLPTDFERPELHQLEGSTLSFELDLDTTNRLKHIALRNSATLYMVLVALVNILLSKECDQEEIIIGTAIAGRRHAHLEPLIGFFVNMLALRNFPAASKTFGQFLLEIKDRILKAYENQDYQFEELVEKVLKTRTSGRNSLVDVGFAFQNFRLMDRDIPNLPLPYDFSIIAAENRGKLVFVFLYRINIFKKETIQMMIQNFKEIVTAVLDNINIQLKDIQISHDLVAAKPETLQEDEGDFQF
jgi:amino acid adenylation domain-containing protein